MFRTAALLCIFVAPVLLTCQRQTPSAPVTPPFCIRCVLLKKSASALIKLYSEKYYFLKNFVLWGTARKIAPGSAAVKCEKIFE